MSACHHNRKPKVKHATKAEAWEHAHKQVEIQMQLIQVYRCPRCRFWHIGRRGKTAAYRHEQRRVIGRDEFLVGRLIAVLRGKEIKKIEEGKL